MARTVGEAFEKFLSGLELTATQRGVASERQNWLRENLAQRFALSADPLLVGSYARHTQIKRDRDIDVLLPLDPRAYWTRYPQNPRELVRDLFEALKEIYPQTTMSRSEVAVSLHMTNIQVDVVPAVPAIEGFYIHDGQGGWKMTNPPFHQQLSEELNGKSSGRLKPLVKLMKAWNTRDGDEAIGSFPLEFFVGEVWRDRQIPTFPEAVADTLDALTRLLDEGLKDPWQQGGTIYEASSYLGHLGVRWRRFRAARTAHDAVKVESAGRPEEAVGKWREVFGTEFPAWG